MSAKLAFITGASGGIGAAIARAAQRDGYKLALVDANADGVRALGERFPEAIAIACDITDEAAVERALAKLPATPELLVNNAGIVRFEYLLDMAVADFRRVLDVDLTGAYIVTRAIGRRLRAEKRPGAIVNIASIGGITTSPGTNAYAPSKAGLISLTQLLALELGPLGIRVNSVSPGFVDGGMSAPVFTNPRTRELRTNAVPIRALASVDDVAEAVMFLASDRAKYVHGHNLVVDGGVIHSVLAQLPRT